MGLYQALISCIGNFEGIVPSGFKKASGRAWIITLNEDGALTTDPSKIIGFPHPIPKAPPGRTAGVIATLIVDKASYAFGLGEGASRKEHADYLRVLRHCIVQIRTNSYIEESTKVSLRAIYKFQKSIDDPRLRTIPDDDIVIIMVGNNPYIFSDSFLARWLVQFQTKRTSRSLMLESCAICGGEAIPTRIAEKVTLFRQRMPISAVNIASASSLGKEQLLNSPMCAACSSDANALLNHFCGNDDAARNSTVLCKDEKKGGGGRPLSNQLAVFWTAKSVISNNLTSFEDVIRLSLDDQDEIQVTPKHSALPQANSAHLKALLESPWHCNGEEVTAVNPVGFYFAILSPNKSRLVIREWIETDVDDVKNRLVDYRQALSIINPQTDEMIVPPLRAILQSLRSPSSNRRSHEEKPRLAEIEPELLRQIIRCMYQGTNPPSALLTRAVQAFRIPVAAADEYSAFDRLCARRTTLAAAIKLVLTYRNKTDQIAMEQLVTKHDANCSYKSKVPYLCGRLLALLNEIQYRASSSRKGVNTTLVDKYYAAASTAPNTVFGNMLKLANTAHLPKLRKDPQRNYAVKPGDGKDPIRLSDLLNEVAGEIDSAERLDVSAAFPNQLNSQQQAEFALGYHHQQAILNPMSR